MRPRNPPVINWQKGVRPPIPGSPIPQPEKNRRVCVEGRQAKALQAEASCGFNSRHIHLGYASRCGRRMHRRLHQGNIIITCSASGSTMGCSRPLIFPGESRDKLPRQGGEGGAYATSASWLRLFHCFSTRSRGAQTSGLASFIVVAAPPGRSEQNRSSPPPLTLNGESEGIFFFVIK